MTKRFFGILLLLIWCTAPIWATETDTIAATEEKLDVKAMIFDHVGDAYEWHITTIGHTHVSIPLPIIVIGTNGFQAFMSSELHHAESYKGYRYGNADGKYRGKIVELDSDGNEMRPLDFSLTKNAVGLLINSVLVLLLILWMTKWYKSRPMEAPNGVRGILEMVTLAILDGLVKPCVGKDYARFAPYLLTVFWFIFINNLMGLIPIFPGGANTTGNIAVTLVLAVCTFLTVNIFGTKEYWKEILWPDVPLFMKAIPLMPLIELFGIFTKPFSLMIRLFANILAGHAIVLGLMSLIFITASMGAAICSGLTVVSIIFTVFMDCVELLVAFLQAYVFTMLSSVFIGLARVEPHKKH